MTVLDGSTLSGSIISSFMFLHVIEPEEGLTEEELHGLLCGALADDDFDVSVEECTRQCSQKLLVISVKYLFQHSG